MFIECFVFEALTSHYEEIKEGSASLNLVEGGGDMLMARQLGLIF